MPTPRRLVAALSIVFLAAGGEPFGAQDAGAGADQKLRVARRLAAEGSPDAAAAFAKVATEHPDDPLADDALVEHAAWLGAPAWPEDLGSLADDRAPTAFNLLRDAAAKGGDRRNEALHRTALLQISTTLGRKPGDRRDLARIRPQLLEVASASGAGAWSLAARYALAWVDEGSGEIERARAAYQRLVVDEPGSEAGLRAEVGLGRVLLRLGEPGRAAAFLQEAAARGAASVLGAEDLRELAVRTMLRSVSAAARWSARPPRTTATGVRGASAIARAPGLGTLVADRRAGAVLLFDTDGKPAGRWPLEEVQALAVDPLGRIYAAADEKIYRLAAGGRVASLAPQGDLAPVSALAVDAAGRIWLVDRRGERIGRVEPGSAVPAIVRERRGAGFSAIAWDGARLLAAEEKTGRVVEVRDDGTERPVVASGAASAAALAVDPAGAIAVVDARSDTVVLFGPRGDVRDRFGYGAAGVGRIAGAAFGRAGDLELLEGSTGSVLRLP